MISTLLLEHIFKAASMPRWNDYPKMVNLIELDKQAHKFIIAYLIAKFEDDIDMDYIIKAGIFDFFSRIILTDIRPDVFRHIKQMRQKELNDWILQKFKDKIIFFDNGYIVEFEKYLNSPKDKKEDLILKAAGYLATKWEFEIIYQTGRFLNDIEELKRKVDEELEDYYELIGVQKIAMNQKIAKIVDLSGRLRFQKRWAQTPRIPETSVLGHMLIVAILGYFYSKKVCACKKRLEFNFFCAIFHDLPESLTRDIISPVKYGVSGLDDIINDYEMRLINDRILPFIPQKIYKEFSYILGLRNDNGTIIKNEFENRIFDKEAKPIDGSLKNVNEDRYCAIDGKALKYCDKMAAFFEAGFSIYYGIKSRELINGFVGIYNSISKQPKIEDVDFLAICYDFAKYFELDSLLETS